MTRTISQAELRNGSAGVMDALEAGEDFIITRHGVPVGELRPLRHKPDPTAEELIEAFRGIGGGSLEQMRAEADELLGSDRLTDDSYP